MTNGQRKTEYCDGIASLGKKTLVQRISGILSACNMHISNSKLCESSKRSKPLVDEHAFPPTGFAESSKC